MEVEGLRNSLQLTYKIWCIKTSQTHACSIVALLYICSSSHAEIVLL